MRISVIAVGRLRPPYQDDVEHYRKLLGGPCAGGVDRGARGRAGHAAHPRADPHRAARERRRADGLASSFSGWLEERRRDGRDLCFVIGGPRGLELEAESRLSLGPDDAARTSSRAWCCWSSSTVHTRSSPASPITTDMSRDPLAQLRDAVGDRPPRPRRRLQAAPTLDRPPPGPTSATTPPTRRCCWRPRWATPRARSPSGSGRS